LYADQGKLDLALADYNTAIALNPNDAYAYTNRGMLYAEQ
ncbi:MAG: tetratricopeptide repeat protein, partial [Waterburya sp.]